MTKRLIKLTILASFILLVFSTIAFSADVRVLTTGYKNRAALGSTPCVKIYATAPYGIAGLNAVSAKISRPFASPPDSISEGTGIRHWNYSDWRLTEYQSRFQIDMFDGAVSNFYPLYAESKFLIDGATYTITPKVAEWDDAARTSSTEREYPSASFTYDNSSPEALSFTPLTGNTYRTSISGISTSDRYSGIRLIKAYIYYIGGDGKRYDYMGGGVWDSYYYDRGSGSPYELTVYNGTAAPGATVSGTLNFPSSDLISGKTYYYKIRATDAAGNYRESAEYSFSYDSEDPQANISTFASGSNSYSITAGKLNGSTWDGTIRGTASDPSPGSGLTLSNIRLSVTRRASSSSPIQYFNGTGWVDSSSTSVQASTYSSGNWTYSNSNLFTGAASGYIYTFTVKVTDSAGNQDTSGTATLGIDNSLPASAITTPNYFSNYPSFIEGTASDGHSAVSYVQLAITRTRGTQTLYWRRAGGYIPYPSWNTTPVEGLNVYANVSGDNWNYDSTALFENALPGDVFTVASKAIDRAGNVQNPLASKTLQLDNTIPSVNIAYPRSHFNSSSIFDHISIAASGGLSGILSVQVKIQRHAMTWDQTNLRWDLDPWITSENKWRSLSSGSDGNYTLSIPSSWNLHSGLTDGMTYTITAKVTTVTGVATETVQSIIYDATPPRNPHLDMLIKTPAGGGQVWQNSDEIFIAWTGAEDPAGTIGGASGLPASPAGRHSIQILRPDGVTVEGNPRSEGDPGYDPEFNPVMDLTSYQTGSLFQAFSDFGTALDGIYEFRIKTFDNAGNSSAYESIFRIGIDLTPPLVAIRNPIIGSTIDTTTPVILWSSTDGRGSGLANHIIRIQGGGDLERVVLNETASAAANSYAIPAGILKNSTYLIKIIAVDRAGNQSEQSAVFSVRTRLSPQVGVTSPANGTVVNSSSVDISGTASDDSYVRTIEMSVNGGPPVNLFSGSSTPVSFTGSAALAPGTTNTISVRVIDDTDLVSESTVSVIYDNVPPGDFHISSPADGSTVNTQTPSISWTQASDALSGISRYEISIDGEVLGSTADLSFDLPGGRRLTNGVSHTLSVTAVDNAGNSTIRTSSFTVRTQTPPRVEISSPASGSAVNTAAVNIAGAASDDSFIKSVEMSVNGGAPINLFSGSSPSVAFTAEATLTPDSVNQITIRATDDSDLVTESTLRVTCDTTAPAGFAPISPANNGWTVALPAFSWEESADALSGLRGYDLYIDGEKVNPELITDESYRASAALADGSHHYYAVAWDNVGNFRQSETFVFKVDTVAPAAFTLTAPAAGQYIEAAFDAAWTDSRDANSGLAAYEVYIDGEKVAEATANSARITDVPADGEHTIYVIAQDVAGNTTQSNSVSFTTNPSAPVIALRVDEKEIASGNRIRSLPDIKAQISDNSGIDSSSIKLTIDGTAQNSVSVRAAETRPSSVTAYNISHNNVRLKSGKHTLKVEARDVFGKRTVIEVYDLDVLGYAAIEGQPMNYPNPFKPSYGETTKIAYNLADDADIVIAVYDLAGRQVHRIICPAGLSGGTAGPNNDVPWDGKSAFGEILGNGVYVYIITSAGSVLGSGEIAIYE